jgi:SAM-dependent methyltransferase
MMDDWFAGTVAEHYDDDTAHLPVDDVVDVLSDLARGGPALELAIGTGRIALPLAQRGLSVSGIELSPDMLAQLRKKPGGSEIPVVLGDMATARIDGSFTLVYLIRNTVLNLTTQDAQVACFANAAAHLERDGCFVVETVVPNTKRLEVFDLSDTHVGVDEYDADTQHLVSHHFTLRESGWERLSVPFRAAPPGELDLMARLAGMRLRERWSDWNREPFTAASTSHISVWEKPGP